MPCCLFKTWGFTKPFREPLCRSQYGCCLFLCQLSVVFPTTSSLYMPGERGWVFPIYLHPRLHYWHPFKRWMSIIFLIFAGRQFPFRAVPPVDKGWERQRGSCQMQRSWQTLLSLAALDVMSSSLSVSVSEVTTNILPLQLQTHIHTLRCLIRVAPEDRWVHV